MNQTFDITRAWNFIKLKFNLNKKIMIIGFGGLFGLIFIITFFMGMFLDSSNYHNMNNFHLVVMNLIIFIGGTWAAGRSYQDMNNSEKATSQLMIPSSRFEKFIIPLIFTTIFWFIAVTIIYTFYAFILNETWGILFSKDFGFFMPRYDLPENTIWDILGTYVLMHSIFFLGGLSFKTYPVGKTLLSIFVINISFTVIALVTALTLFGSTPQPNLNDEQINAYFAQYFTPEGIITIKNWVMFIYAVIVPAILYTASYYKLKEREA